jgi:hypothetical protein
MKEMNNFEKMGLVFKGSPKIKEVTFEEFKKGISDENTLISLAYSDNIKEVENIVATSDGEVIVAMHNMNVIFTEACAISKDETTGTYFIQTSKSLCVLSEIEAGSKSAISDVEMLKSAYYQQLEEDPSGMLGSIYDSLKNKLAVEMDKVIFGADRDLTVIDFIRKYSNR